MLLVVACYFDNFVFIQSHGFAPNTAFFLQKNCTILLIFILAVRRLEVNKNVGAQLKGYRYENGHYLRLWW